MRPYQLTSLILLICLAIHGCSNRGEEETLQSLEKKIMNSRQLYASGDVDESIALYNEVREKISFYAEEPPEGISKKEVHQRSAEWWEGMASEVEIGSDLLIKALQEHPEKRSSYRSFLNSLGLGSFLETDFVQITERNPLSTQSTISLECINGEGHLCLIAERTLVLYTGMSVTTSSSGSNEQSALFEFSNVSHTQISRSGGGIVATLPESFKVHITISTLDTSLDDTYFLFRPTLDEDALYRDVRGQTEKFIDAYAEKLLEKIQAEK